jgi:DNA-binding FrmR family transcriptional regulator
MLDAIAYAVMEEQNKSPAVWVAIKAAEAAANVFAANILDNAAKAAAELAVKEAEKVMAEVAREVRARLQQEPPVGSKRRRSIDNEERPSKR